jgi:UDP-2-acetamido-3-amino-2,3-dideoxy-glucuronate N-acetyltransferase
MSTPASAPPTSPAVHASARLEAGAQVDPSATIGADSYIGTNVLVEAGARIGQGVRVGSASRVGANAVLESADGADGMGVRVEDRVRIGPNATVLAGVMIAAEAVVRPGSVVTRSVPPRAIVEGNPAVIVGYVDAEKTGRGLNAATGPAARAVEQTPVQGVTLHRLPVIPDLRGNLTVGEFAKDIPFVPQRYFMVFGVPNREVRGEHAHRECHQFLICVRGSCSVVADDGERRIEVLLDAPEKGLYLPPMTWGIQYRYTSDALLLVFASHYYDAADYIRDYAQYLESVATPD